MANKHAVLSASSSERWLNCPPSARLCENYEDKGSDYAAEGTDAHTLCEFRLKQALGMPTEDPTDNLSWYNEEMEECAAGYAAYVVELLETAKQTCTDPVVMIEQRVNFSRWVQDGFGTADCIVIADGVMNICDYKHGKGVEVSAVANPQMMLYALGALEIFDDIYDIDTVRMTIFQPRKSNVSVYEMEKADLLQWADTELTQKAKLAYEGQGDFHCGEWCRFCKAKAECRERAEANMALARYDFQTPALLDDEEIADILGRVDALTAWASDVKEYALQQAMQTYAPIQVFIPLRCVSVETRCEFIPPPRTRSASRLRSVVAVVTQVSARICLSTANCSVWGMPGHTNRMSVSMSSCQMALKLPTAELNGRTAPGMRSSRCSR